jgi:hypothetical protein
MSLDSWRTRWLASGTGSAGAFAKGCATPTEARVHATRFALMARKCGAVAAVVFCLRGGPVIRGDPKKSRLSQECHANPGKWWQIVIKR